MALPSYDLSDFSDTRELAAKERAEANGPTAADAGIIIALAAIVIIVALLYIL